MELDSRLVDNPPRHSIESVNLSEDRALAYATETRVAGACAQVLDLGRDECCSCTAARCGCTCLGAGMTTSNYDDIVRPVSSRQLSVRIGL